ncbi:MAG: hypothetical protein IJS53_04990, partial [Clostridia bacterium]|nr:hypothetical protein [Clostridia bacterium]
MKKTRRMILTGLALALCLALAVSALAEGTLGTLYRTATALLFDTDNVTLNAHATFAYEGELFKTLDGQCVQSGTDSKLTLMLKTPKKDGSIYEGGYTVIANSGTAYSMETANPQIYSANACKNSASLLSSTVLRRTILSLGSAIADVCEGSLGQKIAVQPLAEGGAQYHLQLAEGDTPQLINAAGTLLAQAAAKRFFYFDYGEIDSLGGPDEDQTGCDVYFEDYDVNFAAAYLAEFGEEFPEDFYDRLWQDDGKLDMSLYERYEKIVDALSLQTSDLQKQYPSGVAMIRTDGSAVHFDTMDAYMIAAGQQ